MLSNKNAAFILLKFYHKRKSETTGKNNDRVKSEESSLCS